MFNPTMKFSKQLCYWIAFLLPFAVNAQNIRWQRTFERYEHGSGSEKVYKTAFGYEMVGSRYDSIRSEPYHFSLKVNKKGHFPSHYRSYWSFVGASPTRDSGLIAIGRSNDTSHVIRKLDKNGQIQWQRLIDTGINVVLYNVLVTSDSSYLVAGYAAYRQTMFLIKFDKDGYTTKRMIC
jgi:hypothetical protein